MFNVKSPVTEMVESRTLEGAATEKPIILFFLHKRIKAHRGWPEDSFKQKDREDRKDQKMPSSLLWFFLAIFAFFL
jgi:hypothetical protein